MLDFLAALYACETLDGYAACLTRSLPAIVRSDICAFNEINPDRRRINWVSEPMRDIPDSREIFAQHMHENPVIAYWKSGRLARGAVKLSDFIGRRDWHDRGMYTEFYRHYEIEHIMDVMLPTAPPRELHVCSFRQACDFSERDRLVFNLLRPHFFAAYANAEAITERDRELAALRAGFDASGRAMIALTPDRRVRSLSAQAQIWLAEYFTARRSDRARLPPELDTWVRRQELGAAGAEDLALPRRPLVVERAGKRLEVRLFGQSGGQFYLLLREEKLRIEVKDIAALGLSSRETEVLTWVATGKTNEVIATILGLSPVTIKHCLERIYSKLNVQSRAQATARAMQAAGRGD
jgi:DNA-binding CsgD family transcriptional regulator